MDIRDLKYLVALADHCHFGKAAKAAHITQPALSIKLKKLEETLAVKLIDRTNKSVKLTDIGLLIVERARKILNQINEISELSSTAKDPYRGELKLGIIPSLAPYLLPHIISEISDQFPNVKLYLIEFPTFPLVEKLECGDIDAIIVPASSPLKNHLSCVPLFEEEFLLAVSNTHSLAQRKIIHKKELQDQFFLLLEEGHCMSKALAEFCEKINPNETNNFRGTSLETLRYMVKLNVGMTFMPKLACKFDDGLTYIPIAEPKPSRTISMLWRHASAKNLLLEDLSMHIKKIVKIKKLAKIVSN